ncbi:hypothetical protein HZA57_03690 [Candidatus Poribacteria bacterium]|nr:hypothetical protein [Candidatus Poribacteria bacterium]
MKRITDPDVLTLANCSATLKCDYAADDRAWEDSPFAWIKSRPSRQVGVIGEKLVSGWLATKGFDVTRSPDSQADRLINGKRAEIKFSTLWKSGFYKFQQLRNQNYLFAICLGVSPFDAHCWVIPKVTIMEQWGAGNGLESQHGGQAGTDTAWLTVSPGRAPTWLRQCGGPLGETSRLIAEITGKKPLQ